MTHRYLELKKTSSWATVLSLFHKIFYNMVFNSSKAEVTIIDKVVVVVHV